MCYRPFYVTCRAITTYSVSKITITERIQSATYQPFDTDHLV